MGIRVSRSKGIRLLILGCLLALCSSTLSAQVEGTNADVNACVKCHKSDDGSYTDTRSGQFVLLTESTTWKEKDPHALAFAQILPENNPVAKRMQTLLANGDDKYRIAQDYRCLTCHSSDTSPSSADLKKKDRFVAEEKLGVGCAVCHGVQTNWQDDHWKGAKVDSLPDETGKTFKFYKWRTETPAFKAKAGMRDLRNPQVKADLCASCHVGSPEENKVVTHEMYAAGHPPLPPMELVTFMEGEPRHWGYPSELKFLSDFANRKPKEAWDIFHIKPEKDENYLARHVVAGAIASLKAEMKLLAAEAEKNNEGLDYARFDCYSCHHDLKYPSPRQERGYAGRVPGRPPLKSWVTALPGMVISNAGEIDPSVKKLSDQFPDAWKTVAMDSTTSPFAYGKGANVAKSAKALAAWCDTFSKSLETVNITDANADALLAKLKAGIPSNEWSGDTEATMHLLWAYRSLKAGRKLNTDELNVLDEFIPTRIRNLEKVKAEKTPIAAGLFLPDRLRLFANFDPRKFNEKFTTLK